MKLKTLKTYLSTLSNVATVSQDAGRLPKWYLIQGIHEFVLQGRVSLYLWAKVYDRIQKDNTKGRTKGMMKIWIQ